VLNRRNLVLAVIALTAVLAQTELFPNLRAGGVIPDIVLVSVIAVALEGGPESGAVYGFGAGLFIDMFLRPPAGLSALAYTLVGFAVGSVRARLIRTSKLQYPLVGGLGSLLGGAVFVIAGVLVGQQHLWATRTVRIIAVRALYDATLAFLVFPAVARLLRGSPSVASSAR
jgi:rod shape-determining protein MreD